LGFTLTPKLALLICACMSLLTAVGGAGVSARASQTAKCDTSEVERLFDALNSPDMPGATPQPSLVEARYRTKLSGILERCYVGGGTGIYDAPIGDLAMAAAQAQDAAEALLSAGESEKACNWFSRSLVLNREVGAEKTAVGPNDYLQSVKAASQSASTHLVALRGRYCLGRKHARQS
jgi:hypothetical protein